MKLTTKQGSRVSCLAQIGFAAFGKGVQLISGPAYTETEELSRLTSSSGLIAALSKPWSGMCYFNPVWLT